MEFIGEFFSKILKGSSGIDHNFTNYNQDVSKFENDFTEFEDILATRSFRRRIFLGRNKFINTYLRKSMNDLLRSSKKKELFLYSNFIIAYFL